MSKEDLKTYIEAECLQTGGDFTLTSSQSASFYFDCKRATLHGPMLTSMADAFLAEIEQLNPPPAIVAGPTLGADPIVTAIAMRAAQTGKATVHASIVRKEAKKHGTKSHIENEGESGARVVVVEDVITTGGSLRRACDHLLAAGFVIGGIVCLVDREAGGAEDLAARYDCPVRSIFTKSDFEALT